MNRWQDISISDASLKAEFITKFFNGDYIDAFTIISNNPQLNTKAFVADTINQIATILLSLENNFQNGVIDYLSQQYLNFQNIIDNYNLKGNWSSSTTYQIYNFVTYNNIDYLYINLTPSSGNLPTNTDYWVEINIQGEKGAPGLGVNLQYNWNPTTHYNALDVVYYNNALWVARVANINKIPGSTEEWETLTGPIVSFYNDGDIEISNLSVDVEPVQAGSGDPSPDNVRPISGRSGVNVTRTGKNLLENIGVDATDRGITAVFNDDGTVTLSGTNDGSQYSRFTLNGNFQTKNGVEYTMSGSISSNIVIRNVSAGVSDTGNGINFTGTGSSQNIEIRVLVNTAISGSVVVKPMIRLASITDATYEPYSGNTYTIQLGQTVYGCRLTIADDGSVTALVDRRFITIDGNSNIGKESTGWAANYEAFYLRISDYPGRNVAVNVTPNIVSNQLNAVSYNNLRSREANAFSVTFTASAIYVEWLSTSATVEEEKARITNAPIQVAYELATPFEIQLDPVTISTIANQTNNVWADAGDVTVELDKKYWEEFIKFKLASIYTDYVEPSGNNLYNGLIWFEVFNPQNWSYLTNRNYTWNQINTNNDTWESVDRGDY